MLTKTDLAKTLPGKKRPLDGKRRPLDVKRRPLHWQRFMKKEKWTSGNKRRPQGRNLQRGPKLTPFGGYRYIELHPTCVAIGLPFHYSYPIMEQLNHSDANYLGLHVIYHHYDYHYHYYYYHYRAFLGTRIDLLNSSSSSFCLRSPISFASRMHRRSSSEKPGGLCRAFSPR